MICKQRQSHKSSVSSAYYGLSTLLLTEINDLVNKYIYMSFRQLD